MRVFIARPGWRPEGVPALPVEHARDPSSIPNAIVLYTAAQFVLSISGAFFVCILRDALSLPVKLIGLFAVLACLTTLGGLLDGRRHAWRWELARVIVTVPALAWVALR